MAPTQTDSETCTRAAGAGLVAGAIGEDMVVGEHETLDRIANLTVTVLPLAFLGLASWLAWGGVLQWQDLVVLAITYVLTGLGVTVGYHRLFTHRSFKTSAPLRILFGALGSAAIEGPVIEWVLDAPPAPSLLRRSGRPA